MAWCQRGDLNQWWPSLLMHIYITQLHYVYFMLCQWRHKYVCMKTSKVLCMADLLSIIWWYKASVNTLKPEPYGQHFADNMFKCVFLKKKLVFRFKLHFVLRFQLTVSQVMARCRIGNKPLPKPMMTKFICVSLACISTTHSCQVTLDISRSPIDFQWGSWKYPG